MDGHGQQNGSGGRDEVFSKRIKAGRRTYFIDVKSTRGMDYYLTITESKRVPYAPGYEKHKIFLYKEDFHKFLAGLNEAVSYIKTELMPDFDFDKYAHHEDEYHEEGYDEEYDPAHPLTDAVQGMRG